MGGSGVGRNFQCLSKVLAQYQLAKHLRNDHGAHYLASQNRSPLESTFGITSETE